MLHSKFYLNKDFFDFCIGICYPVFDNIYLRVVSKSKKSYSYKTYSLYTAYFSVKIDSEFIDVFSCQIIVQLRRIQLINLSYIIDSDYIISSIRYFPLSPAWHLPATNYTQWLNLCRLSLQVYRKADIV